MLIARLAGVLFLIAIGGSLLLYLLTRHTGYLRFAWQLFRFGLVFAAVFAALYVLERLVLVA